MATSDSNEKLVFNFRTLRHPCLILELEAEWFCYQ